MNSDVAQSQCGSRFATVFPHPLAAVGRPQEQQLGVGSPTNPLVPAAARLRVEIYNVVMSEAAAKIRLTEQVKAAG
jgi:hypothetical protein